VAGVTWLGCHGGQSAGEGTTCNLDHPCRQFLACVQGICRQIPDAAIVSSHDSSDDPSTRVEAAEVQQSGDKPDAAEALPSDRPDERSTEQNDGSTVERAVPDSPMVDGDEASALDASPDDSPGDRGTDDHERVDQPSAGDLADTVDTTADLPSDGPSDLRADIVVPSDPPVEPAAQTPDASTWIPPEDVQIHIFASASSGHVDHIYASVADDLTWVDDGDIAGALGNRGTIEEIQAQTLSADEIHLIGRVDLQLYHAVRTAGQWTAWQQISGDVTSAGFARAGQTLTVCDLHSTSHVFLRSFTAAGGLTMPLDLTADIDPQGQLAKPLQKVACAATDSTFQLVLIDGTGHLKHAWRNGGGQWSPARSIPDVSSTFNQVSLAVLSGQTIHMLAGNGETQYHSRLTQAGTWTPFEDVSPPTSAPSGAVSATALAGIDTELNLMRITAGALYHSIWLRTGYYSTYTLIKPAVWDGFLAVAMTSTYR
jgi:hypothetical protein